MPDSHSANPDQAALWNGPAGQTWVELQSLLDEMLAPFGRLLIDEGLTASMRRVLDVGCGAGSTSLAVARRVGAGGRCIGVDISATLLELARKRAREEGIDNATFLHADAQTHPFEPNSFDAVISRFGVMFFDDPVTAFTNIRHGAQSGAMLTFIAWRSPAENPFMTAAARAAAPFLPALPTPDPNAPGQFGFADADRVRGILQTSGWSNIDIRASDVPSSVTQQDLRTYITRMGPVGLALKDVDEETRAKATAAVHGAFDSFIEEGVARFTAACWLVRARA
jgi:SAM-dependent methyltransferase